VQTLITTN